GGFYSQRQYRALVAYAQTRFVEVVPEIDMPGHVNAALASYARLTCNGKAPAPYTGIDVGFSSLCIDKELTYRFLDDVIGEVAALTPGRYVHMAATRRTPPTRPTTGASSSGSSRSCGPTGSGCSAGRRSPGRACGARRSPTTGRAPSSPGGQSSRARRSCCRLPRRPIST